MQNITLRGPNTNEIIQRINEADRRAAASAELRARASLTIAAIDAALGRARAHRGESWCRRCRQTVRPPRWECSCRSAAGRNTPTHRGAQLMKLADGELVELEYRGGGKILGIR